MVKEAAQCAGGFESVAVGKKTFASRIAGIWIAPSFIESVTVKRFRFEIGNNGGEISVFFRSKGKEYLWMSALQRYLDMLALRRLDPKADAFRKYFRSQTKAPGILRALHP